MAPLRLRFMFKLENVYVDGHTDSVPRTTYGRAARCFTDIALLRALGCRQCEFFFFFFWRL